MIQTYLAEMESHLQAARLLVYRAAALKEAGETCTVEAATAKLFTTESAVWLCDRAVQIHGGYGYAREYVVERLYRDSRILSIGGGTTEIMKEIISKMIQL